AGQAIGAGEQLDRLADDGALERVPRPRRVRPGCPPGAGAVAAVVSVAGAGRGAAVRAAAVPLQLDAQPDQLVQGVYVDLAGHDRGHGRVAGDRVGGVAVQPGALGPGAFGGPGAVRGPLGADLGSPFVQQGGAAVDPQQVGQGDVDPG